MADLLLAYLEQRLQYLHQHYALEQDSIQCQIQSAIIAELEGLHTLLLTEELPPHRRQGGVVTIKRYTRGSHGYFPVPEGEMCFFDDHLAAVEEAVKDATEKLAAENSKLREALAKHCPIPEGDEDKNRGAIRDLSDRLDSTNSPVFLARKPTKKARKRNV